MTGSSNSKWYSSYAPSGDASRVRQVGLSSGFDTEQSCKKSTKVNGVEHNLNGGVPSRHTNSRPRKRSLDLQLPASTDADDKVVILREKPPPASTTDADDSDDDVVILWEKPGKSLPRTSSSVLGGKLNLNLEGSSHMNSWIFGLQPSYGSRVNLLNKEIGESSDKMKTTVFPYVGTSTPRYSSAGVNLKPPSLQDNLKEKGIGESSGSQFFGGDKRMKHTNSYIHSREDQNNSMSWFKHKQNGVDFSEGHCMPSFSACNPQIRTAPSSNATLKSPWQSSMANTPMSHCIDVETPFAQNGFSMDSIHLPSVQNVLSMNSARLPTLRRYHPSKVHKKAQHQKHSVSRDGLKDMDLNSVPRDFITSPEQEGENTPMDISWITEKLADMTTEESPSCENEHSKIVVGSTMHSEGSTRIFGFPISTVTGKDSGCSSTPHIGTNSSLLIKGEADMGKSQNKKEETNAMRLIDLNVALPFMDDLEMDVCQSGGDTVPQEPDASSNGALDIGAANNILPVCKEEFEAGSPQGNVLLWFANIAVSQMNILAHGNVGIGDVSEAPSTQLPKKKKRRT